MLSQMVGLEPDTTHLAILVVLVVTMIQALPCYPMVSWRDAITM